MNQHQKPAKERNFYDRIYRWLLIIPAALLFLSVIYLFNFYQENGDVIYKDVSLTGGTTLTVFDGNVDVDSLKAGLKNEFPDLVARSISDIRTGKQQGFFVETKSSPEQIKPAVEKYLGYALTNENSSVEFTGSSLSAGFYQQLRMAILIAFVLMALTVFIIFRTPVPCLAVILAAFANIAMTLAVVNLFGMQMSVAGIVAFLMLIGYSVDTDILLTSRCLKTREGSPNERILGALKTGMTMTLTAIVSIGVSLIIIYNFSDTLRQIFSIVFIGLSFDILNTWISNASILKWHMEAKE